MSRFDTCLRSVTSRDDLRYCGQLAQMRQIMCKRHLSGPAAASGRSVLINASEYRSKAPKFLATALASLNAVGILSY